jgi:PIN domain nuclease of toxin-antitoxin system
MNHLLADTHILLWALDAPERLSRRLRDELDERDTQPVFSVISLWEISIKTNLGHGNLRADARAIRTTLRADGWMELPFEGEHAIVAGALPRVHGDPFDRALIAQALSESFDFVTSDRRLRDYGAPVRLA